MVPEYHAQFLISTHSIIAGQVSVSKSTPPSFLMPTTRSASKRQKSLEDYGLDRREGSEAEESNSSQIDQPKSHDARPRNPASKRKSAGSEVGRAPKKLKPDSSNSSTLKQKQTPSANTTDLDKPILINRSPVLQIWAATVAKFLHPDEEWDTCLSVGSSISTLCAISKGRAIGKIEPKDSTSKSKDKNKKETHDDTSELEVMGFTLQIKDGAVVVDDKTKPVKEHLLQAKFGGEEEYTRVRRTMEEALRVWSDDKEQLDKKAFHMYEQFRPSTAAGSSGWGRKGQLHLQQVKSTVESKS